MRPHLAPLQCISHPQCLIPLRLQGTFSAICFQRGGRFSTLVPGKGASETQEAALQKRQAALRRDLHQPPIHKPSALAHNPVQQSICFLFRKPLVCVAAMKRSGLHLQHTHTCFGYHQNNCKSVWWLDTCLHLGCSKNCRQGWVRTTVAVLSPLDLLEARVAAGALTTCSNPLFIGNPFLGH